MLLTYYQRVTFHSSHGVKPTMLAMWRRRLKQRIGKRLPWVQGKHWVLSTRIPSSSLRYAHELGLGTQTTCIAGRDVRLAWFKSRTWRACAGASRQKSETGPHSPPWPSAAWGSRWAGRLGVSPLLTRWRKTAKSVVQATGYLRFHNIMVQTLKC